MNGHPESSTSTSASLLESLEQLDLSALKNHSPSAVAASYDRLLETARMISTLNVGKDLATVKDRDQHQATLTKLLQVSQTIIDALLARAPPVESKNDINAQQNSLRQENAKLRKLLSLQQKAIAFRRANLWTASDSNNNNSRCEDEDISTSAAVDVSLDDPNSNSALTSTSANKSFLQCIYCPKIFADASSFARHLSLRHLSSSIDDGLPSSISSSSVSGHHQANNINSSSFMQRLHLQYQKALEMKTINSSKSSVVVAVDGEANGEVINRLQAEIGQLKAKLAATEQALDEEKSARASFESDLKQGLAGNVQQLQAELAAKIEEVRSLVIVRQPSPTAAADATHDEAVKLPTPAVPTKKKMVISSVPTVESATAKDDHQQLSKNTEAPASSTSTASQLKQTLRLQLISQLTSKGSESSSSVSASENGEVHHQQQQIEPVKEKPVPSPYKDANNSKELTKAEISTSVESRLREYLQQQQQQQQQQHSPDDDDDDDETVPEADPQTPSALSLEAEGKVSSTLDESHYSSALSKVQRDRELLIQQSRHDYDFVAIESSLRQLIDSKLRSKLQAEADEVATSGVQQQSVGEEASDADDDHQQQQLMPSAPPEEDDHQVATTEQQTMQQQPSEPQQQQQLQPTHQLKSILKSPRRAGARPKTRRKSIDSDESGGGGDQNNSISSHNRRISFSEQIIEFPISPRESEGEDEAGDSDDVDDDADLGFVVGNVPSTSATSTTTTRRNQMFVIRSLDSGGDDDHDHDQEESYLARASRQLQQQQSSSPLADSFAREKIFINEYSTSSSSSSSEEEEENSGKSGPSAVASSSTTATSIKSAPSNQEVVVEVHQLQPARTPVPAARRSKPSTLDSLLLGDDSPPPPPQQPLSLLSADEPESAKQPPYTTSSSTRVQELAELIERKLQQKQQRSSSTSGSHSPAVPFTGAVDTVASLRPPSSTSTSSSIKGTDVDYDIYDF